MWTNKINQVLNIIIGVVGGIFIGKTIYTIWDYKMRPEFYMMQSAPWYTSILVYGVATANVLLVGIILKFIIWKKKNKLVMR